MTVSDAWAGGEPAWVHGHSHDPNPTPPSDDSTIYVRLPDGSERAIGVDGLQALPYTSLAGCYIVSTGHGTSGPFTFGGVLLRDFLAHVLPAGAAWSYIDIISGDGFGTRLTPEELAGDRGTALLAYALDGAPLTRRAGLVRLIVPAEKDDALKQVKWIARIEIG